MKFNDLELDAFQAEAISALDEGRSVLVCAPTGTGKTIIADWLVDRTLNRKRQIIYTAPIKALSNQKFRDWTRRYGDDAVGLLTGDLVIRRDAGCRVMTTEILRNMLLGDETFRELDAVIIDEIHFLDDRERGTVWEELLIYLPKTVQILGLSATLSNASQFAAWMSEVRQTEMKVIRQDKRTVPLDFWIYNRDSGVVRPQQFDAAHQRYLKKNQASGRDGGRDGGRGRGRSGGPTTSHADAVHAVWEANGLPCLYFVFSRKLTEQNARGLTERLGGETLLDADAQAKVKDTLAALERDYPQLVDADLRAALLAGVAWHHAGVHVQIKALVEDLYERRLVRVLYCTSTFALGINMPARTVIFDGLKKFDGISMRPLTTREFLQKAGRAGRRGMDTEGHVVIRMDHGDWDELRGPLMRLLEGQSEPVRSSFSLSFNSVVNLLSRNPIEKVRDIVDKSFLSFARQAEARRLEEDVERLKAQFETAPAGNRGAAEKLARKQEKELHKLERRVEDVENRSWMEFESRIRFLVEIGYLAPDLTFNAGGKVLMNIQMEEIFVTELVLSGLFEDIDGPTLFGLLCAVNKEFGRDVRSRARLKGPALEAARAANKIRMSPVVTGAERLTGFGVTWCPDMIPFGAMWAEGRSFNDCLLFIDSSTDMSGDLVGAFRRAKDLIGQLKDVYRDDDGRKQMLTDLLRAVSRDEVLVID